MTNPHVDELSMMTYLSQFPEAELKEGAPLGKKTDISQVKVSGSGVTGKGAGIGKPADIIVDCSQSGIAPVTAKVQTPSGETKEVDLKPKSKGSSVFIGSYNPTEPGNYTVDVTFDGEPVPDSPYKVNINDIDKVKVSGPGVTGDGAKIGEPAKIIVDCSESGVAPVTAKVKTPSGETQDVKFEPTTENPNIFEGTYEPKDSGNYDVAIDFDGEPLPNSPIKVPIKDPSKVKVSGPGVTGKGANVGQPAEIIVDCSDSGVAPVSAKVTTPSGETQDVVFKPTAPGSSVFTGSYAPSETGDYNVEVDFDGEPVQDSPYKVNIKDINKVKVSGPGVTGEGAKVGEPAKIIVDCSESGVAPVSGKVKTPSGEKQDVKFEPTTENPNIFEGSYEPKNAGDYEVALDFDERPLPNSPIKVPIRDITKVKVSGSGISGEGARVGQPANIIVDCSDSGVAPVTSKVTTPSGDTQDVTFQQKRGNPNVYEGFYTPKEPGYYGAEVEFNGEAVPDSPYQVPIGKPEAVRIGGDGLEMAFVGEDNIIDVFTDEAGPGDVSVKFRGPPRASPVTENVVKVDDNHYQVHYSPQDAGVYDTDVCFNGFPVEDKPRKIPTVDLSKVEVTGPGIQSGNPAKGETYFLVDARRAGDAKMDVSITDPEGKELPLDVSTLEKNAYKVKYTPQEQGDHVINIKYGGRDLKDSPYFITVDEPGYVKCTGEGLTHAVVNQKAEFEVDATRVGSGSLGLSIEGPMEPQVTCEPSEENGKFKVTYIAPMPGKYTINIKFSDEEVRGAPFEVVVASDRGEPDATKCIVTGIESGNGFQVDCSNAGGTGLLEVGVSGSQTPAEYIQVKHMGDYKFDVSYHIVAPGETIIIVKWHGEHLEGSPFTIITE